jgi:3-polyprenyl-4-hydroxybenzoate decarboxylase
LTVDDMVAQVVGRIMDVFGLELKTFRRWKSSASTAEDLRSV